jgi:hypothetical protein
MMPANMPTEIVTALAVIDRLDQSDQTEYAALKKALPILAVKLQQSGEDVTENVLEEYALLGSASVAQAIKTLKPSEKKKRAALTYEQIVSNLAPQKSMENFNEQADAIRELAKEMYSEIDAFYALCLEQPMSEVRKAYHEGLDVTVDDNALLRVAVSEGSIDLASFLIEKGARIEDLKPEDILNCFARGEEAAALGLIDKCWTDECFLCDVLMLSAKYGYHEVIEHLYEQGFDVLINDSDA